MKRIILLVLLVNSFGLFAQTDYYWYKGQKVFLERLPSKRFIIFDTFDDSASLKGALDTCFSGYAPLVTICNRHLLAWDL